jgi:prevent-host-death family protein
MKTVTATEANRDFSKLLEIVSGGEKVAITKRGRMVATINPVKPARDKAEAHKRRLLARLRKQPLIGVSRGARDELYED